MFEIGITDEFEAAHSLEGNFGPATRLHGHTYKVEVRIEGRTIDSDGILYDIGRLRGDLHAILGELHYRNLNDLADLAGTNTTAEVVAKYIFEKLSADLQAAGVESLKVTVWESPSCFSSYRESFDS